MALLDVLDRKECSRFIVLLSKKYGLKMDREALSWQLKELLSPLMMEEGIQPLWTWILGAGLSSRGDS